tara:strand:+ start:2467 stop:2871 length:405 start_codon:yes stop_codon:yes gene_type:complete
MGQQKITLSKYSTSIVCLRDKNSLYRVSSSSADGRAILTFLGKDEIAHSLGLPLTMTIPFEDVLRAEKFNLFWLQYFDILYMSDKLYEVIDIYLEEQEGNILTIVRLKNDNFVSREYPIGMLRRKAKIIEVKAR